MKIKEILKQIGKRGFPCVAGNSGIGEVLKVAAHFPHTRLVYVIDDQKKLIGVITIGSLMRHLYPHHYKEKIHSRDILRNISVDNALQLMGSAQVIALLEETVDVVLKRMASTDVKQIAVVDSDGLILADLTAVDLLSYSES